MKIALAQLNPTVGDFSGNAARIRGFTQEAQRRGAQLAVFSELCLCGYLPQDLIERPAFLERNRTELASLAKQLPIPAVIGYVGRAADNTGKPVTNSPALVPRGPGVFQQNHILLPPHY